MKKTTWGFALFETVLRAAAGSQCVVTPMESMPSSVQYGWASFCVQWQLKPELITLLVVWIKRMRRFYFCWVVAVLDVTTRQLGIKEVRAKCCSELFKLKLGAALKVPDLPSPASGSLSFLFVPTNRNTAEQAAAMPCVPTPAMLEQRVYDWPSFNWATSHSMMKSSQVVTSNTATT